MKNPKNKGNTFEREISERLSLHLTKGKEKRAAWRSDTSGAAATIWDKKKLESRYVKANAGDIKSIAPAGLYLELDIFFDTYVVECKHYKEIDFYPPYNGTLVKFLEQCLAESKATGKKPILILKANNRKVLYCTTVELTHKKHLTLHHKTLTLNVYLFDDIIPKHEYKPGNRSD